MPFPTWWYRILPFGRRSEIDGAGYLRSLGFRVVASGYRTRAGEVDLVAWEGDQLVFVEVKARRSEAPPEDAVGFRKQQRVIRAAHSYMTRYHHRDRSYRFDVLAVTALPGRATEFRLLRDAFREIGSGSR
ncbi:MAG TPA: YraN family protein [Terriglobia bacterium]|nr:YraN family protein [Terriglobia bacterium]